MYQARDGDCHAQRMCSVKIRSYPGAGAGVADNFVKVRLSVMYVLTGRCGMQELQRVG